MLFETQGWDIPLRIGALPLDSRYDAAILAFVFLTVQPEIERLQFIRGMLKVAGMVLLLRLDTIPLQPEVATALGRVFTAEGRMVVYLSAWLAVVAIIYALCRYQLRARLGMLPCHQ